MKNKYDDTRNKKPVSKQTFNVSLKFYITNNGNIAAAYNYSLWNIMIIEACCYSLYFALLNLTSYSVMKMEYQDF